MLSSRTAPPPAVLKIEDEEVILHWTEDGKNHKKSQRELAEGAKTSPKNMEYFRAQIALFAKMCLGQQHLANGHPQGQGAAAE